MMEYGMKPKQVEHKEIVEHFVTESRRSVPTTYANTTAGSLREILTEKTERIINEEAPIHVSRKFSNIFSNSSDNIEVDADKRFFATGERDCSRDISLLQTSGMSLGSQQLPMIYDNSSAKIDSYGYDVHEIHTSEGGARIVQTHGSGVIHSDASVTGQNDKSMSRQRTVLDRGLEQRKTLIEERNTEESRSGSNKMRLKEVGFLSPHRTISSGLQTTSGHNAGVYTLPTISKGDTWKRAATVDSISLTRKDSYKRMQMGQQEESADVYTPRSDASLMTGLGRSSRSSQSKLSLWEQIVHGCRKLIARIRKTSWTPRMICLLLLFLLLVALFFALLGIILSAIFGSHSVRSLLLYPPLCDECRRRAANGIYEQSPSTLHVHFSSSSQVQFELNGNAPFKSNSFTAADFETGYTAVADHALTDSAGMHFICFLIPLDRSALPNIRALRDALSGISSEVFSEYGWQEYWQYQVESISTVSAERKFTTKVDACRGARWYLLKQTIYTKDSSCSDCYDFCLPDYSIQRLHRYEDEMTIGIRRLNCFRLHVPEWAMFQNVADGQGGHWSYPKISKIREDNADVK